MQEDASLANRRAAEGPHDERWPTAKAPAPMSDPAAEGQKASAPMMSASWTVTFQMIGHSASKSVVATVDIQNR